MKTKIFAIALLMSGAAFAQTVPDVDADADVGIQRDGDLDVDANVDVDPAPVDQSYTTQHSVDHGTMTQSSTAQSTMTQSTTGQTGTQIATNMSPASGAVVQPSNADPEHDARGIAVISDPAVVPAGYNGLTGTAMGGPLVDPATGETVTDADASYPPCTANVTDNCLQTYERGRSPQ